MEKKIKNPLFFPLQQSMNVNILQKKKFMNQNGSKLVIRRKWQKVIQPIVKYKRKMNGIDEPLDFYYQLQKMIENGYKINLNIPYTLTGARDNYLQTAFQQESQQIGEVKLTPSYSKIKFQLQAQKVIKESIQKIKNKNTIQIFFNGQQDNMNNKNFWLPFVVMKQKSTETYQSNENANFSKNQISKQREQCNITKIENSYQFKKISNIDTNQISQVYIYTQNLTASIVRYFYSKNKNKSTAFTIQNQQSILNSKKSKLFWKVNQKKNPYSCRFVKIMHENKSFHKQTINLIHLIEKHFKKQVNKLVTDWILDTNNKYYLIDVKQVQLTEPKPRYRISKSLTQLLSTVTCSMCLQTCHQSEITKVLTNKLICNFYQHLTKRGISLSFRINFKKITSLSRVCDLCYSLVVAQTKLIQAERKMCQICHFGFEAEDGYNCFKQDQDQKYSKKLTMNQWRLFFYLQDIKDFFNIFNLNKIKDNQVNFYLRLEIHDSQTFFQLNSPFQNNLQIKGIKIEYFFSQSLDIRQFLEKAQVKFQILTSMNSIKPIAQGGFHRIFTQDYHYSNMSYLQRKYKQILLFNQQSKYSVLGLYIGIYNDGPININNVQLRKTLGIFKPESKITHCQNLPTQWMQIIYQNYCQKNSYSNCRIDSSQQLYNIKNLSLDTKQSKTKSLMSNQRVKKSKQKIHQSSISRQSSISLYNEKNLVRPKLVL